MGHAELFDPNVIARGRKALVKRCEWFVHGGRYCSLSNILNAGLAPATQTPSNGAEPIITSLPNPIQRQIVCLSPFPRVTPLYLAAPYALFAIHKKNLPAQLGLDWSFDEPLDVATRLFEDNPEVEPSSVFERAVLVSETLVSYDRIPVASLRVCTTSTVGLQPSSWPTAAHTRPADIHCFPDDIPIWGK